MSNPFIQKVEILVSRSDISQTWRTLEEAKKYVANIQQLKKEIRLVKGELTMAKGQIHAQFASKQVHVGKGFGAGVATGLFGARTVGKMNSLTRNNIRGQELKAMQPYREAEQFINKVVAGLDKLKLEIQAWMAMQPKR